MTTNRCQVILGTQHLNDTNSSIIDYAIKQGVFVFDTADCYGKDSASEKTLGAILANYPREEVVIGTKCGVRFTGRSVSTDGSREYLLKGCEASLARLNTPYIDLFSLHRVGQNVPIEESMLALKELVHQKKIRAIGLSEVTADQIRRAHTIHPVKTVQIEFSPWSRQDEYNGVISTCHELDITVTGYSPLGRAFFSNTRPEIFHSLSEKDYRKLLPRYNGHILEKNLAQRIELENYAKSKSLTLAQLALIWVSSKNVIPIFGTHDIAHFDENMAAFANPLNVTDLIELNNLVDALSFEGERYPCPEISGIFPEPVFVAKNSIFAPNVIEADHANLPDRPAIK